LAVSLLRGGGTGRSRLSTASRQTIDAEILRLAVTGGRLTAVEVATALTLTPEMAKESSTRSSAGRRRHCRHRARSSSHTFDEAPRRQGDAKGVLDD
jgi:hypothetical protein